MKMSRFRSPLLFAALGLGAGCATSVKVTKTEKPAPAPTPVVVATVPPPPAPPPTETLPPPPEVVDTVSTPGTIEPAKVAASFAKLEAGVDACWKDRSSKYRYLGGEFEAKLYVKHDGTVARIAITKPLGNNDFEVCVENVISKSVFPAPTGGTRAEVGFTRKWKGEGTLVEWGNEKVSDVFAAHRAELDKCNEIQGHSGGVPPSLRVALFVLSGGRVETVGVGADLPVSWDYATCISGIVQKWKFPDAKGAIAHVLFKF